MNESELVNGLFGFQSETRLRILRFLASAGDVRMMTKTVADHVNCSDPVASKHLRILSERGLVEHKRESNYSLWLLVPGRVTELCSALFSLIEPIHESTTSPITQQSPSILGSSGIGEDGLSRDTRSTPPSIEPGR